MTKKYNVAVVGATGAVGTEMIKTLEQRNFPVSDFFPVASMRSKGKKIKFRGKEYTVQALDDFSFKGIDIVLSSAGASTSKKFAHRAAEEGAVVIDNTSAFRMEKDVPLVVPEVNPHAAKNHKGIIANPNCSTIQMVVAINPIHKISRIKRIIVSTYQAVSGSGAKAIMELENQIKAWIEGKELEAKVYPHPIAFNCLPHIDIFMDNLYTKEEMKMVNETKKIMEDEEIKVSATTVRVPVFRGHSESVWIETENPVSIEKAREVLKTAPGVVLIDNPQNNEYPLPIYAAHQDPVYVGRIRKDLSNENGLVMWVVADNLRKGAALNAVQIAELLIEKNWL